MQETPLGVTCAVGSELSPFLEQLPYSQYPSSVLLVKNKLFSGEKKKPNFVLGMQLSFIVLRPVYTGGLARRAFCVGLRKKNARRRETRNSKP